MDKRTFFKTSFCLLFLFMSVMVKAQLNPNGGFESGTPGEHTGTEIPGYDLQLGSTADAVFEIVADTTIVHSGQQCIKVTVNAIGTNAWEPQIINQQFSLLQDTTYVISVWAKSDVAGAKASFTCGSLAPNYHEYGRVHEFALTTEWQEITLEVRTRNPETEPRAGVPIHFGVSSNQSLLPASFYIDDISVKIKGVVNPNGGFENTKTGEVTGTQVPGWDFQLGPADAVYEVVADSESVHSGNQALKVTVNTIGSNAWEPQLINTEFPVSSNTTYSVSAWAKADVEGALANFTTGSLSPNYYEWGRLHQAPLTKEWAKYSWQVTTRNPEAEPRGGVPIHLGAAGNQSLLPVTFYFDDIEVIQNAPAVGINDELTMPKVFSLAQNYPNPFNPATTISFSLPQRSEVHLVLMDILGKVVNEIASGSYEAGAHQVILDASQLASGVYFYRLQAGQFISTKKLVLLK